jgi:uncharacterized protein with von Willebrand factor type A (vWA) domain
VEEKMFTEFFYQLRREGIPVSITEWLTLMEALSAGLAETSLSGFYYLARAVLVKSECHFNRYDLAFQKYFQGIETPEKLQDMVFDWLKNPIPVKTYTAEERHRLWQALGVPDWESLRAALEELLLVQDGAHHGGIKWIGTGGSAPFGNAGFKPGGMRIDGESNARSAVKVAAERNYRAYRSDQTLGVRQFEIALRRLRQFSSRLEGAKDQLDLSNTIDETCRNAGKLKLVWTRSRKNTVKVIVLMDIGGSMYRHAQICSRLFSAVHRSVHFQDLRFYYFHNCIYDYLYLDADYSPSRTIQTEDLLRSLSIDYKLVIVGDAAMSPSELLLINGNIFWEMGNDQPGITWLEQLAGKFSHNVWLNPIPENDWEIIYGSETIQMVRNIYPMYELTLEGLEKAIKKLMVRR